MTSKRKLPKTVFNSAKDFVYGKFEDNLIKYYGTKAADEARTELYEFNNFETFLVPVLDVFEELVHNLVELQKQTSEIAMTYEKLSEGFSNFKRANLNENPQSDEPFLVHSVVD